MLPGVPLAENPVPALMLKAPAHLAVGLKVAVVMLVLLGAEKNTLAVELPPILQHGELVPQLLLPPALIAAAKFWASIRVVAELL